jgi:DNA-binding beta-propeller fold protein YncE
MLGFGQPVLINEATADTEKAPRFEVDPNWPKPLPNNWLIGQVGGIAVDKDDRIWILQRARTLTSDEAGATDAVDESGVNELGQARPAGPISSCCIPAPAVMQFDREGNLLRAWGGPADPGFIGSHAVGEPGCDPDPPERCQWPAGEHGLYVDHNDFVYIGGNGFGSGEIGGNPAQWAGTHGWDSMVLKFSKDGTFLYQIGDPGQAAAVSNDTNGAANGTPQVWRPADTEVDPETNELYIADGYGNHRVLVVDAEDGMYKRHWGAYGQNPVDDAAADAVGPYSDDRDAGIIPLNFRNPVHCARITHDGLVYVCDRPNDRIQVFKKDTVGAPCINPGQEEGICGFVEERFLQAETLGPGSVWDLDTSADEDQSCLHNADGSNQHVQTLHRASLEIVAEFGRNGRSAGQFHWLHNLAVDSEGNIYTAEVDTGKRAQKFRRKGRIDCKGK